MQRPAVIKIWTIWSFCKLPFGKERNMKGIQLVALVLVVVGAVNWGLVGVAQFDLVAALFGGQVYTLVGVAGVALATTVALTGSRTHAPIALRS
jgi:uncharacterized protein